MAKLLIVGGHPKGHEVPFHPSTRSGKILRKILSSYNIEYKLMDLWNSQEEENEGNIKPEVIRKIKSRYHQGYKIIVVGKYMYGCLEKATTRQEDFGFDYLPHPASRSSYHRKQLEVGLRHHSR